jgi:hypothetical protein
LFPPAEEDVNGRKKEKGKRNNISSIFQHGGGI